jgi:molybdopterin-guanine dinucleotide biosynthesis protein A
MASEASGLILAGGASRRLGRDKAALMLGKQTLLDRTISILSSLVDDVLVVGLKHQAPDPTRPDPTFGPRVGLRAEGGSTSATVRFVPDDLPDLGPLGGLLTGLRRLRSPYAVVVACDLPFLDAKVLHYLLGLAPGHDAVVPVLAGRNQSLHAVYARSVEGVIARHIARNQLRLDCLLAELTVRRVEASELETIGFDCRSFTNVNTPEDWDAALRLTTRERRDATDAPDR